MMANVRRAARAQAVLSTAALMAVLMGPSPPSAGGPPAPFRRVFVPEASPDSWPTAGQVYLPVDGATLDRLLAGGATGATPRVIVERIDLTGRTDGDARLWGEGTLTLRRSGGDALLPWPMGSTAILDPVWQGSPDPALLGVWASGAPPAEGRGLWADRDGTVRFTWSAPLQPQGAEGADTILTFPPAVERRLTLRLGACQTAELPGSIGSASVRGLDDGASGALWRGRGPNSGPWRVGVRRDDAPARIEQAARPSVRWRAVHSLSESGDDVLVALEWSPAPLASAPLPRLLEVDLPEGCRVLEATCDGVSCRATPLPGGRGGVAVELPEPSRGGVVRLRAWRGLELGAPWRLPTPRVAGATLTESLHVVRFAAGVGFVDAPRLQGAVVDNPRRRGGASGAAEVGFRPLGPDASVTLVVGRLQDVAPWRVETRCEVTPFTLTATCEASPEGGAVSADLPTEFGLGAGWAVQDVEATLPASVESWRVEATSTGRRLVVTPAPGGEDPQGFVGALRVVATLAGADPRRGVLAQGLVPLEPPAGDWQANRLVVVPAADHTLTWSGTGDATPVSPQSDGSLAIDLAVDPMSPANPLVRLAPGPGGRATHARVSLRRLGAAWRGRALVGRTGIDAAEQPLLVRFTAPVPPGAEWRGCTEVTDAHDPVGPGRAFRVILDPSGKSPGSCEVLFSLPDEAGFQVPLPSVAGGDGGEGALEVFGCSPSRYTLQLAALTPQLDPKQTEVGRFAYTYRWAPRGVTGARASVGRAEAASHVTSGLTLRRVETTLSPGGGVHHRAVFSCTLGAGAQRVVRLPAGAEGALLHTLEGSGPPVPCSGPTVTVVGGRRPTTFTLEYATASQRWAPLRGVVPALPDWGAPPGAWTWRLTMPVGVTAWTRGQPADARGDDWRARLLGEWAAPGEPAEPAMSGPEATSLAGFRVVDFAVLGDSPPRVTLVAGATGSGATLVLGLLAFSATLLTPRPLRWGLAAAPLLLAVAALLGPIEWAPFAAAACWGSVLALAAPLALAPERGERAVAWAGRAALALILAVPWAPASGAQPEELGGPVEMVLIPVTEGGEPAGDKRYIREGFYRRLVQDSRPSNPPGAVLRSLRVEGVLGVDPQSRRLTAEQWSIAVEAFAPARDSRLRLEVHRDDARWAPTADVNGARVPLTWEADGKACWAPLREPGRCRLHIEFSPTSHVLDGTARVEVAIPPTYDASLRVEAPPAATGLAALGAGGRRVTTPRDGLLEAPLAGADRFVVTWRQRGDSGRGQTPCDVVQLVEATPEAVTLRTRVFTPADASATPVAGPVPPGFIAPGPEGGHYTMLRPPRVGEPGLYELTLRAERRSPVGAVVVPPVAPEGWSVGSRLVGVAAPRGLRVSFDQREVLRPIELGDFNARWADPPASEGGDAPSEAEAPTLMLASEVGAERAPIVLVSPAPRSPEAEPASLWLHVGGPRVSLEYAAPISPAWREAGACELLAPEGLRVQAVGFQTGAKETRARWRRPEPGRVVVFPTERLEAGARLVLRGQLPVVAGAFTTPRVTPVEGGPWGSTLTVTRDETTLVTPAGGGLAPPPSRAAATGGAPVHGRMVGAYGPEAGAAPEAFTVAENHPQGTLKTLTRYAATPEGVVAEFVADVRVKRGQLGVVEARFPAGWQGIEVASPAGARLEADPSPGAPLRLRFGAPVGPGEGLRLVLRASRAAPFEAPLPEVLAELEGFRRVATTVALRASAPRASRLVARGMAPTRPDAAWAEWRDSAGPWSFWRPNGASPRVELPAALTPDSDPAVWLSDSSLAFNHRGVALATQFLVDPRGAEACLLRLPAGCVLDGIEVNGVPPMTAPGPEGSVRIGFLRGDAPQALSVATHVEGPLDAAPQTPWLANLKGKLLVPATTLWGVWTPDTLECVAHPLWQDQAAHRLARLHALSPLMAPGRDPVATPWLVGRVRRLADSLQDAADLNAVGPNEGGAGAPAADAAPRPNPELGAPGAPGPLVREAQAWLDEWGGVLADAPDASAVGASVRWPEETLGDSLPLGSGAWRFAELKGEAPRVVVAPRPPVGLGPRLALASLCAALSVAVTLLGGGRVASWAAARPRGAVVALGLAWWAWLPAGALGLLLAAAALTQSGMLAARRRWA